MEAVADVHANLHGAAGLNYPETSSQRSRQELAAAAAAAAEAIFKGHVSPQNFNASSHSETLLRYDKRDQFQHFRRISVLVTATNCVAARI